MQKVIQATQSRHIARFVMEHRHPELLVHVHEDPSPQSSQDFDMSGYGSDGGALSDEEVAHRRRRQARR